MFNETIELEKALQEGEENYYCSGCDSMLPARRFPGYALRMHRNMADPDIRTTHESRGGGNATRCGRCRAKYSKSRYLAQKEAGPRPTEAVDCACCGSSTPPEKVHMDHCHETHVFRGWLCNPCNTGIGSLGDNIEGLERAIDYLKKTYG